MGQSRMRIANWWYSRKDYSIAVKCYKKALQFYNNIPTNQVKFSIKQHHLKEKRNLLYFVVGGVFHCRGVQGVVGPDGGEAAGNETGGQHLQEDRKSHSERTYRDLVLQS